MKGCGISCLKKMARLSEKQVLLLNSAYEPMALCSVRRAMKLIIKGTAKMEEFNPDITFYIGTVFENDKETKIEYKLPSVIRLVTYRYIPSKSQLVTRKNIFARDMYTCQYCGIHLMQKYLTLDHIIPQSRGGKSTWSNLVAACKSCNRKKDNKLLSEITDMQLKNHPREWTHHVGRGILRNLGISDEKWRKYLYFENTAMA